MVVYKSDWERGVRKKETNDLYEPGFLFPFFLAKDESRGRFIFRGIGVLELAGIFHVELGKYFPKFGGQRAYMPAWDPCLNVFKHWLTDIYE